MRGSTASTTAVTAGSVTVTGPYVSGSEIVTEVVTMASLPWVSVTDREAVKVRAEASVASTSLGPTGSIAGAQYEAIELQYAGGGVFAVLSYVGALVVR